MVSGEVVVGVKCLLIGVVDCLSCFLACLLLTCKIGLT